MASRAKGLIMSLLNNFAQKFLTPRAPVESDSDDEEEEALSGLIGLEIQERVKERRPKPLRMENYAEIIVPAYSIATFKSHFRMTPAGVEDIENKISETISRLGPIGRLTVPARKQILSVIWLLATPDSFRSVAEQFGMSKATLHGCYRRVIHALCGIVKTQIYWPQGADATAIMEKFRRLAGMPNVIGALDGCQIEIDAPKEEAAAYRTGKKKYAVQLQAVCTSDLILTDVFAGYPGSVHDVRVLKNSPLFRDAEQMFQGDEYIVGDKAYPACTWCIPPYKNYGNITEGELAFNRMVSQTRQPIERCFCLLKGRFRRLKHLAMHRTDEIAVVIMACCVLHNICLRGLHDAPEDISEYIDEGANNNPRSNRRSGDNVNDSTEGVRKRDSLKRMLVGIP